MLLLVRGKNRSHGSREGENLKGKGGKHGRGRLSVVGWGGRRVGGGGGRGGGRRGGAEEPSTRGMHRVSVMLLGWGCGFAAWSPYRVGSSPMHTHAGSAGKRAASVVVVELASCQRAVPPTPLSIQSAGCIEQKEVRYFTTCNPPTHPPTHPPTSTPTHVHPPTDQATHTRHIYFKRQHGHPSPLSRGQGPVHPPLPLHLPSGHQVRTRAACTPLHPPTHPPSNSKSLL